MPPLRQVTLKAPATSANLGPGFDVFGLALEYPTDKVTLTLSRDRRVKIKVSGVQAATISTMPDRNTAGVVANFMMQEFKLEAGVIIRIEKGIWPSKGLGSSAASAAAVAVGLNKMFNLNLNNTELVRLAAKGEIASAGAEHADNVSATICGDFVILKSYDPLEMVNFKAPADMELAAAFPHMVTPPHKTEKARSLLPKLVPIENVVKNLGNAAAMVSGFATGNVDLIGRSMQDAVAEPARAQLIPGFAQVKEKALRAGACGVTISGAGPAVLAVVNKRTADAGKVAAAMREGFRSAGFDSTAFATKPGRGVYSLEK
jgi:homoserine kinase